MKTHSTNPCGARKFLALCYTGILITAGISACLVATSAVSASAQLQKAVFAKGLTKD